MKRRFAGYPAAVAYDKPDGKKAVQHLLWGDFVGDQGEKKGTYSVKDVHREVRTGKYVRCHIRGRKEASWIREHEIQDERCLEVIFVDIGQGDGCLVITPDDDKMVIDAGQQDNMYRFLRWRFGRFDKKFELKAGIISHPDSDHYKGFEHLFGDENVFFETIYHNGIMEEKGKTPLGPKEKIGGRSYLTGLITNKTQLKNFFKDESRWKRKQFPTMLKNALDGKSFGGFKMLSIQDGYMPGYGPDEELSIQVLGPVVEPADAKPPKLRWITDKGKTKNGHSVVLRYQYRNVSLLLGGDLNIPSEHLLLSHHTGLESPADNSEDEAALVEAARKTFQVDVAKSCHHGSSDFAPTYMRATNPIATVISSGDAEPHSHPRADTLGSIGLHSRGTRPLIFSTELARSAPEAIKHPNILQRELERQLDEITSAPADTEAEKKARDKKVAAFKEEMDDVIDRSVAVFGAINVVTDGHKVVIAQKLEEPRGADRKWDIYRLEAEGNGPLRYQSKH
ncbi:MAG: hypothetical protein GY719_29935 [bacterium]|nr:hypothetical protein [bacterium]